MAVLMSVVGTLVLTLAHRGVRRGWARLTVRKWNPERPELVEHEGVAVLFEAVMLAWARGDRDALRRLVGPALFVEWEGRLRPLRLGPAPRSVATLRRASTARGLTWRGRRRRA